ncbi:protein-disulfide reductase DsbD domain-containing protein [Mucilaginibacter sp. AW1-7]|uniref:protein-disulfide reductase DsbD domain-containing protein n=1 Tax=Mucilaginibacter sp. AW1-7 TaxID=3349874 RepID=UPI003F74146F
MKKIVLIALTLIATFSAKAQIEPDPTKWAYGLKKLSGNTYEVHLLCTIKAPWHIYAQKQGKDFIGTATKISFAKQPGLTLIGKPIEKGKLEKFVNKEVDIVNLEYKDKVDFVQKVTIKPGIKEIKGTVHYQTCTDERCLPEASVSFTIPVN